MVDDEEEAVDGGADGEVVAGGAEIAGDERGAVDGGGDGVEGAAVPDGLPEQDAEAGEGSGGATGVGGGVEAFFEGQATEDGSPAVLGEG